MIDSINQYTDKIVIGLIGLFFATIGWIVRVVFTNSKKVEKTEVILEHVVASVNEHREDMKELRKENTFAMQNQARIIELMERVSKDK
jgi:hypothetical protein